MPPADQGSAARRAAETVAAVSPRKEAQLTLEQYKEIYDRLIKIFQERPRDDWKKLIVFSKQWNQHQQGVFDRYGLIVERRFFLRSRSVSPSRNCCLEGSKSLPTRRRTSTRR